MTTSFPAIDVAIGLSFAFFLLSVLSTAATETVSQLLRKRSRQLETWLGQALGDANTEGFYRTPVVRALEMSSGGRHPSYIPSTHFVTAVLSIGSAAPAAATNAAEAWDAIGEQLSTPAMRASPVGQALNELYVRSDGSVARFRHDSEAWFDDQMERLSGVYRRWSQVVVWVVGAVLVLALNVNTFR